VARRGSLDNNDFIDRRERWRRRAWPIAAGVGLGVYVVTAWFRR